MTDAKKISIYIDADACPVKEEALKVAYRHGLPTFLVSNQWLRIEVGPQVQKIVVSDGADAADDWIAEHITEKDIGITADIPLAKRCLDKGATALGPTGRLFSEENIGMAMAMRDLNAHRRETGESRGLNPTFSKADRSKFLEMLEKIVQEKLRAP
ncbi:YaiI/YqxD family protein [Emcibacter sp.]|uniref:YaiI/YqxD family protein n=1 Tax=Emcibacter sp. TaxID=1979954 RepID=UPI003A8EC630